MANANTRLALVLVLGVVLGVAMFALVGSSLPQSVPTGHSQVAATVHLTDTTMGVQYAAVFVRSGETVPLQIVQLSFSGQVTYSLWEFRSTPSDPSTAYAVMRIWGPGSVGEFFVEVTRLSTDGFTGTFPSGSITWTSGGNDGYIYFQYTP